MTSTLRLRLSFGNDNHSVPPTVNRKRHCPLPILN